MDVSIDSDALNQLNNTKAKALHELSLSLSACGVDKMVNLPQIIVVGDQSSGKSSVLEAISRVRFPVESGLCTRFATELVLRRASETNVNVSVRFADKSKAMETFKRTGFRENDLPDIIQEAQETMGLTRAGKGFSEDILRLEIEGPQMYPLSLVDLPGLFRNITETQSPVGREIVDHLVEGYMRQKNSIILVVITANNPLASHEALRRVKAMDPHGQRTIGVITKPDLVRAGFSDEQTYVRVAKNQEKANKLQLGWHVLRNRAEDEASLEARDEIEEAFFKTGAWASVPPEDRGITSFRKKLSEILYNHIRTSLPSVVEDIEQQLKEREEERARLGDRRSSEDMRSFLLRTAGDFQRLARDGISGRYDDDFFGGMDGEDLKLRALVRNFNRAFDHVLRTKGSTQAIVTSKNDKPESETIPEYMEDFLKQYPYEFPDPAIVTREELNDQLQRKAAANQGLEFPGYANSDLAVQLFKRQALPWKKIAGFHIDRVTTVAKVFVDRLFTYLVRSPQTTEAILSTYVDQFFEKREKLLQTKLDELLRAYSQGHALPIDVEFYHSLSQRSADRVRRQVREMINTEYPWLFNESNKLKLTENIITKAVESNERVNDGEFGTDKVINSMLAYYEMARRTFTDNVINLAIENCLMCDIPTIFTPTDVNRMSDESLQQLAAESDYTISRRRTLKDETDVLRRGLAQCRACQPRPVTVLPSSKAAASMIFDGKRLDPAPTNAAVSSSHQQSTSPVTSTSFGARTTEPTASAGSSIFANLGGSMKSTGRYFDFNAKPASPAPSGSDGGFTQKIPSSGSSDNTSNTDTNSSKSLFNSPGSSNLTGQTTGNNTPLSSAAQPSKSGLFGSTYIPPSPSQPSKFGGFGTAETPPPPSSQPSTFGGGFGGRFGSNQPSTK